MLVLHEHETVIPIERFRQYSKTRADKVIGIVESRDVLVFKLGELWRWWNHDDSHPDNLPPFNMIADSIRQNSGLKQLHIDSTKYLPNDAADYFYRSVSNITSLECLQLVQSAYADSLPYHLGTTSVPFPSVLPPNLKHLSLIIETDNENHQSFISPPFRSLMEHIKHSTMESLHIKNMGGEQFQALVAAISNTESTLRLRSLKMEGCRLTGKATEILANWFIRDHCQLQKLHLVRITRDYCDCNHCVSYPRSIRYFKCTRFNREYEGDGMPLENLFYYGTKGDLNHLIFDNVDASIWDSPSFCELGPLEEVKVFEMSTDRCIVFSQDHQDDLTDCHCAVYPSTYPLTYTMCYRKFLQKNIPNLVSLELKNIWFWDLDEVIPQLTRLHLKYTTDDDIKDNMKDLLLNIYGGASDMTSKMQSFELSSSVVLNSCHSVGLLSAVRQYEKLEELRIDADFMSGNDRSVNMFSNCVMQLHHLKTVALTFSSSQFDNDALVTVMAVLASRSRQLEEFEKLELIWRPRFFGAQFRTSFPSSENNRTIISALTGCQLKEVIMPVRERDQLHHVLFDLIGNNNCMLERLEIDYQSTNRDSLRIDRTFPDNLGTFQEWILAALRHNRKLKSFVFFNVFYQFLRVFNNRFGQQLEEVLWDKTSLQSTIESNHSLCQLSLCYRDNFHITQTCRLSRNIQTALILNDKEHSCMQKVFRSPYVIEAKQFYLPRTVLPAALAFVGSEEFKPHILEPSVRKPIYAMLSAWMGELFD